MRPDSDTPRPASGRLLCRRRCACFSRLRGQGEGLYLPPPAGLLSNKKHRPGGGGTPDEPPAVYTAFYAACRRELPAAYPAPSHGTRLPDLERKKTLSVDCGLPVRLRRRIYILSGVQKAHRHVARPLGWVSGSNPSMFAHIVPQEIGHEVKGLNGGVLFWARCWINVRPQTRWRAVSGKPTALPQEITSSLSEIC